MKLTARRAEANAAFAEVRHRERVWSEATRVVRGWCARHRIGVIVGGGVVSGLAASLLPLAPLMRLLSAFAGAASLMLEGPFLRMLADRRRDASRTQAAAAVPTQ